MRLFVGLGIPQLLRQQLVLMAGGVPGAHWMEFHTYHMTLRFIGEIDRLQAEDADAALAEISAPGFSLELAGVGQFRSGNKPRVLWVGATPNPALNHLARKIDRALVAAGLPPEDRNFSPHVTLALLRDAPMERVMRFISEHALFRAQPFAVDRFALYESRQGNQGPVYVPLTEYPLEPA